MKKHLYKWAYLVLAILVISLMSLFAKSKINTKPNINIDFDAWIGGNDFKEINYTDLKTDSFQQLAKRAYGQLLQTQTNNGQLIMNLSDANQLGSDFYNSNENLLKLKLKDFGFEIKKDDKNGTVQSIFTIKDGNFVSVPNDVLIKMMYKAYNK